MMAVPAGAAKCELDHVGLSHDHAELAPQRRHQLPVPFPRFGRQASARSGKAVIPLSGEQILERDRRSLEGACRYAGGECSVGRVGDRAGLFRRPRTNRRAGAPRSARAGQSPFRPIPVPLPASRAGRAQPRPAGGRADHLASSSPAARRRYDGLSPARAMHSISTPLPLLSCKAQAVRTGGSTGKNLRQTWFISS